MRNRPLMSGCLIIFFLLTLCINIGGARFVKDLCPSALEKMVNEKAKVRLFGQVFDLVEKENYQILYLQNNSIIYQNKSFKESKIIIYDEEKSNIDIGNWVTIDGRLSFYENERNPGNFNQKLYYQKQGIRASVWAEKVHILDEHEKYISDSLYKFRLRWKRLILNVLGEEDGTILSAMLLAEKAEMDEETKELYQANGIAHVLAISGLHLSVIGVGLYKLFRRLSGSFLVGGIAGMSFLVLYIMMIGTSVSVIRALIMFLFRVGADMAGRHYDSLTALSVAAVITIIWRPLYLYDGGFWLSYGAILAIIFVLPVFENVPLQGLWASISINIMTLPILIYYFYEIPLYSVVLNVVVVPLMTVVLLCGLMGSLCCAIFVAHGAFGVSGIGGGMLQVCKLIFHVYEWVCELFLELPFARIVAGQPKTWQMVVYYIFLLAFIILWRWKKDLRKVLREKLRLLQIATGVLLIINISGMIFSIDDIVRLVKKEVDITVLDVGQGDGIFIRGPKGNTYLIDGGSSDVSKVGKYRVEPFLKSKGVGRIDYVFVSHGDGDHISGIEEMIERKNVGVAIETIVFPDRKIWDEKLRELARMAMESEVRVVEMKSGQVLMEGDMKICCLAPLTEYVANSESVDIYQGESNMASMILALTFGEFDMLFTGDVEKEGEEILTEVLSVEYPSVNWDVLKVAHHGSKNSSLEEFLNVVAPAYSIISAGRDNTYGHPHEETIERLENVGSEVLSTQECGAITIRTDGRKMNVGRYLKQK